MLWILINIRPHIRPHIIDLLQLLWHVRAPARILCFLCVFTGFYLSQSTKYSPTQL